MKRLALACALALLTACTSAPPKAKLIDDPSKPTAQQEIQLPAFGNPRPKLSPDVARDRAEEQT